MARGDPYLPSPQNPADTADATFDGSGSATNSAIINSIAATFDATVFYEAYDGANWQQVAQLTDANGNTTFSGEWHTQFNRLYVSTNDRRVRITNLSGAAGWISAEGEER